ncbi:MULTISPECIES: hypothetical protein [Pseudomonas]|uniref:hypothetical protein n=1 Tax=Pseudomonas TaxID=286 RepID=UPI001F25AE1A|nr:MULTISPECIES: hypothetical protein [Pseudomonas]
MSEEQKSWLWPKYWRLIGAAVIVGSGYGGGFLPHWLWIIPVLGATLGMFFISSTIDSYLTCPGECHDWYCHEYHCKKNKPKS